MFHTPPYSIQNVSLQECYEYIAKVSRQGRGLALLYHLASLFDECLLYPFQTTNVRTAPPSSNAAAASQTRSSCESNSSPVLLPTYERSEMSPGSHTLRTPGSERSVKVGQTVIKERDSPQTMDRRGGRRYSCTQTR